jgi:hypothetical protein
MQFGHKLHRILTKIHHANDHFGPAYLSKIDLADRLSTASGSGPRTTSTWLSFSRPVKGN